MKSGGKLRQLAAEFDEAQCHELMARGCICGLAKVEIAIGRISRVALCCIRFAEEERKRHGCVLDSAERRSSH